MKMKDNSFYQLTAKTPKGDTIAMQDFKDKAVLIVNTATKCGLSSQFEGLEALHQKYKDEGLVVVGFPCNQFGNQEPETNATLEQACQLNYGVTFQLTEKCDVNGSETHPIFVYLKKELGGLLGNKIKWNFTKFLIDRKGKPYKRFSPVTKPEAIEKHIKKLL